MCSDVIGIGIGHRPSDGATRFSLINGRIFGAAAIGDGTQRRLIIRQAVKTGQSQDAGSAVITTHDVVLVGKP